MPIYTIIAGVNGVGKSSLTGVLRAERNDLGYIIDVDKIGAETQSNPIEAGKIALRRIGDYLEKELSFTQETTLSGFRTEKTIKIAKSKGYAIRMFYIGLDSSQESENRVKNRVEKGGHDVSSKDIRRRYSKRFADLTKILPLCDEVRFYDNENGFMEVAEYKNGKLINKGDYKPLWLSELSAAQN